MDREPEEEEGFQFLGLFEIYKESFKIIFKWRKIFSKITFTLIFPLTFIFLAHILLSDLIFFKIIRIEEPQDFTTPSDILTFHIYQSYGPKVLWKWVAFWSWEAIYIGFFSIFSLFSTSAIVNSIASIYTTKDLTFKKVTTLVPKAWNRFLETFQWSFIILCIYNVVASFLFSFRVTFPYRRSWNHHQEATLTVSLILYFRGIVYISIVGHLASVISVLEDFKRKGLIKRKMRVAFAIFVKLIILFLLIQFGFEKMVVHGEEFGIWVRVLCGAVCFLLLMELFLFGMVVQSVFYLACKSYHHESIRKPLLADHLEV